MKTKSAPKTPKLCPCCTGERGQLTLAQQFELEEAYWEALDAEYEPDFPDEDPPQYWEVPEPAEDIGSKRRKSKRQQG